MNSGEIPIPSIYNETDETGNTTDELCLREELISLAEIGDIGYTVKHIRKANHATLEKIRRDYLRKQTNETNEFISESLIARFSELMDNLEMINESDGMEKELQNNKLLKRDLKNIVGYITPYIPLIGILCGGVIVGKHLLTNKQDSVGGDIDSVDEDIDKSK